MPARKLTLLTLPRHPVATCPVGGGSAAVTASIKMGVGQAGRCQSFLAWTGAKFNPAILPSLSYTSISLSCPFSKFMTDM